MQFSVIGLIFLSFFTIIFWFLELGKVPFIAGVAPFFDGMRDLVHGFYQRTVEISGQQVDFSFLVAIIIMLLIAWVLKVFAEHLRFLEVRYDFIYMNFKKNQEDKFNFSLMQQYLAEEFKNNKHAFLITFKIENILKDEAYNKDFNEGLVKKEAEIVQKFSKTIENVLKCEVKVIDGKIFAYANRFKDIDKSISTLIYCVEKLMDDCNRDYLEITPIVSVDTYASDDELEAKLDDLSRLLMMKLDDQIICLSSFKQRYSLVENPKYSIVTQGIYKTKDEQEEVFYIEKLK